MARRSATTVEEELRALLDGAAPDTGDRLPSERDLAARLGCSRETLRKALAALEREGELWRHVGQGAFRGGRPRAAPVSDTLLVEGATPRDVMRARLLLEPQVAAEAARRAAPPDNARLRARVRAGTEAEDHAACEVADDAFHRTVAQVADNPVLIGFLRYLSGARRRAAWQREWDRTYRRIGVQEFRTIHSAQHDRVVDAIAEADAGAAADRMRVHLETIEAAMGSATL